MNPLVSIVMGSQSDWPTLKNSAMILKELGISYEAEVVSAHRTPEKLHNFSLNAESRGIEVIIAGAGGAAHLPGMFAANTALPVFGVPVKSSTFNGLDSLLSIVQMPRGIAVGTLAVGEAGAYNAAILAASVLGLKYPGIKAALKEFRAKQTKVVEDNASLEDLP